MKKITILIAISLLAGCSGMRTDTTSSSGASSSGATGYGGGTAPAGSGYSSTGNSSTFGYGVSDAGRVLSQSHTIPYAEDPYPRFVIR